LLDCNYAMSTVKTRLVLSWLVRGWILVILPLLVWFQVVFWFFLIFYNRSYRAVHSYWPIIQVHLRVAPYLYFWWFWFLRVVERVCLFLIFVFDLMWNGFGCYPLNLIINNLSITDLNYKSDGCLWSCICIINNES